jgi:multidrug efflux pump subunit AcrA (membrane-fusion protein)
MPGVFGTGNRYVGRKRLVMYLKKEKISIWKWIGLFFGTMILFTILSRAIYQHSTAVVTTKMPTSGTINHTVQITGKTVQNQELAVTTIGGLRIASICVNEGQQVKQGDILFVLDLDYLDEVILKQEQDMKKQQLSVWDAYAQNSNAQKQRENQQAQAEENYDNAVAKAQTAVDRAKRDLERAKTALENYRNGVTDDKAEEEALELACQEARTVYNDAFAALEALEQEIDQAVQDAISQAETELQQTALQSATQPPAETILTEETGSTEETTVPVEPVEIAEQAPIATELSLAQKAEIEASVRASYADRLSAAQASVQQAQQAVTDADAELEAFRQRQSSGATLSEQDYLDAVEQAQEVYDDAVAALESTKTTYGRAVSSANLPASTGYSAQIGQITYDQMKMELEKLEALQEAEGKILSPTDGIVTKCNVQTGEKTTDTTAILLADLGQGCKFSGLATEEDSQYIGVGDKVLLQTSNGKAYKDLPVTTFSTTEEPGGGYRLTVQIPSGNLALGANVNLSFTKKSQPYSCCVPLSALRLDNRNQTYVLVVQQVISVMGTELQAKKVNVTVLEQNETMVALAEGTLGSKDKVIVGSDKTIDIGSRVRVE